MQQWKKETEIKEFYQEFKPNISQEKQKNNRLFKICYEKLPDKKDL